MPGNDYADGKYEHDLDVGSCLVPQREGHELEGAFRVPVMIRWPGHIKANVWPNEMVSGMDCLPTLLAAAGGSTIKDRLLKGWAATPNRYVLKVDLDGYNLLPYLEGSPLATQELLLF
jgi:arylsulfatase A-like enzyme